MGQLGDLVPHAIAPVSLDVLPLFVLGVSPVQEFICRFDLLPISLKSANVESLHTTPAGPGSQESYIAVAGGL